MKVHFSSKSDEWSTPQPLFDRLSLEHGPFDLDVCATPKNTKCAHFYNLRENGLSRRWYGRVWMNPPYGRTIGAWMKRALEQTQQGLCEQVVCLVPARTDTAWWHDYAAKGEVQFIRGRIKFRGHKKDAPFPSAIVIFRAPQPIAQSA